MSEKFTFNKLFWNGRAVYLDKPLFGPQTVLMNSSGNELLSCSAFSVDKNSGICGSSLQNLLPEILHRRMIPDQFISFLGFRPQVLTLPQQLILIQRIPDTQQHSFSVKRLFQKVKRAQFCGIDCRLDRSMTGDHDHLRSIRLFFQLFQDFQPILAWEFDIQQNKVQSHYFLQPIQSFFSVCGFEEIITFVFQDHLE